MAGRRRHVSDRRSSTLCCCGGGGGGGGYVASECGVGGLRVDGCGQRERARFKVCWCVYQQPCCGVKHAAYESCMYALFTQWLGADDTWVQEHGHLGGLSACMPIKVDFTALKHRQQQQPRVTCQQPSKGQQTTRSSCSGFNASALSSTPSFDPPMHPHSWLYPMLQV